MNGLEMVRMENQPREGRKNLIAEIPGWFFPV